VWPLQLISKGNWSLTGKKQLNLKNMDKEFNLQRFIIMIVIVGISLVLGIYINDTIGDTVDAPLTAASIINETGYANTTGYTLYAADNAVDFASPAITALFNRTDGTVVGLGNVTVSDAGVVTNATATVWNNLSITYTYTYTAETSASTAASEVTSALSTGTSWISILVVVGFAVIIFSLLTRGFGEVATKESAMPYY